ncbi:hypothetical protein C8R44DRAFT_751134 [Mycena epipterygia]|nr:hypothetical protein C8R44DRAFT_751134 [Mycena epipterygia]
MDPSPQRMRILPLTVHGVHAPGSEAAAAKCGMRRRLEDAAWELTSKAAWKYVFARKYLSQVCLYLRRRDSGFRDGLRRGKYDKGGRTGRTTRVIASMNDGRSTTKTQTMYRLSQYTNVSGFGGLERFRQKVYGDQRMTFATRWSCYEKF